MTREEFDKILIEEGIDSASMRDQLWEDKPTDNIDEERLRETIRWVKKALPLIIKTELEKN